MRRRGRGSGESLGKLLMGSKIYRNTTDRAACEAWRLGSATFAKEKDGMGTGKASFGMSKSSF